jgi:hypothetical protein
VLASRVEVRRQPSAAGVDVAWRVLAVAVVYAVVARLLGLMTGSRPSLTTDYLQTAAISLVTGAVEALVLLPLARRLPYRMRTRFLALFMPLYWIGVLSNLVEAAVNTSLPGGSLVAAAVIFAIPDAVAAWMIAWLLPAAHSSGPVPGLWEVLRQRPLRSWAWRILAAGLLFAAFLELFGILWGPLISKYYQDPTYIAQVQTVKAPDYIVVPEEIIRGVIFVLVLLPVLAVMPGRGRLELLRTAAYIALIDAAFESWLAMLAMTSYPLGFRIGEGLDLTTDAIARGIIVAVLLALPVATTGGVHEETRG